MTWVRFEDDVSDHPKLIDAGNAAVGVWFRSIAHCNKHRTNGRVSENVSRALAGPDGQAVIDDLLRTKLWERCGDGGYLVHDYLQFQPSADQIRDRTKVLAGKRSEAGKLGAAARWSDGKHGKRIARKPSALPSAGMASAIDSGWQNDAPTPDPDVASSLLERSSETGTQLSLEPSSPNGDRMPLKAGAPLRVLTETSGGRFPAVEKRDVSKGQAIAIVAALKRYPLRAEWERLGRWLASGGIAYRTDLGVSWVASAGLGDAMAAARTWDDQRTAPRSPPPTLTQVPIAERVAGAKAAREAFGELLDKVGRGGPT